MRRVCGEIRNMAKTYNYSNPVVERRIPKCLYFIIKNGNTSYTILTVRRYVRVPPRLWFSYMTAHMCTAGVYDVKDDACVRVCLCVLAKL